MSVDMITLAEQVRQLVKQHEKLKRNGRFLFAAWHNRNNEAGDVNLFEVYEDFPDPGVGRLETFLFPSSTEFPIIGSLRLTITSPSEMHDAAAHDDATMTQIMSSEDREVIYPENADWDDAFARMRR